MVFITKWTFNIINSEKTKTKERRDITPYSFNNSLVEELSSIFLSNSKVFNNIDNTFIKYINISYFELN